MTEILNTLVIRIVLNKDQILKSEMLSAKMNQNINSLIEDFFFEEMSTYSPNSKRTHRTALNSFFSILKLDNTTFDENDILSYFNSQEFDVLNPSTQNVYKRYLKKFFKWYGINHGFLKKIKRKREKMVVYSVYS